MSDPCEGRHDLMWDPSHGGFAYCRNCNWASLDPIRKDYTMTDQEKIASAMPGDWIRAKWLGHEFEGKAWSTDGGYLFVGPSSVRLPNGNGYPGVTDIEVIRAAWPPGTVLSWISSEEGLEGQTLIGVVDSDGMVTIYDHLNYVGQDEARVFNPTVRHLGFGG